MTGLQVAITGGALVGAGIVLLVWRLAPADPDLAAVMDRVAGPRNRTAAHDPEPDGHDVRARAGLWAMRRLPPAIWGKPPTRELALLRIPLHEHYGKKVVYGLTGLVIPPLLTGLATLLGWSLPVVVPTAGSLGLAMFLFLSPDLDVRADAKTARVEFARALSAYIDLVALERAGGAGARQAMEAAAQVGDSWVFHRLAEELARSRWSGQAPWEALRALADELGLPDLADLADIMRLSGEEGSQVYTTLRARAASMRTAMLNDELAKANAVGERMSIPMSLLGVIFMVILIAPSLLRVLGG